MFTFWKLARYYCLWTRFGLANDDVMPLLVYRKWDHRRLRHCLFCLYIEGLIMSNSRTLMDLRLLKITYRKPYAMGSGSDLWPWIIFKGQRHASVGQLKPHTQVGYRTSSANMSGMHNDKTRGTLIDDVIEYINIAYKMVRIRLTDNENGRQTIGSSNVYKYSYIQRKFLNGSACCEHMGKIFRHRPRRIQVQNQIWDLIGIFDLENSVQSLH